MFLIITRNFPPDVGGIQVLMGGLAENLLNHGPVKVFADEYPDSNIYDSKLPMDIERIKGIKIFKKYRKANLVNNFIKKNPNIRAIFADHWKSLELINTEYLKKTKSYCLLHSKEINHEKGTLLNKRLVKSTNKANFIIANSNFTKNLAIKVGINSSKIHVIFPGIPKPKAIKNVSKIKAENIFGKSFPKIITVARLDKRKSHDKILMLIKNLKPKFPKIKYVCIGTGEEENNLIKLAKELSLKEEVIFLKNIDFDLKIALISESNLFLMPSRIEKKSVEGFGIAFVEAASYGVASIGGKDGGASDAIKHNITGLICDGNDLNSIYDSVINFFQNDKFITYGKDAKKFSEKFSWNLIIKNYLKLIN
ncbi:MAG: glycosyltransferase family 1 protein [Candidatus Pelagibacterales bacterium]|nr:MAG: glycosyltransferase family 1 protein [Pelagibacterales bacterium]